MQVWRRSSHKATWRFVPSLLRKVRDISDLCLVDRLGMSALQGEGLRLREL